MADRTAVYRHAHAFFLFDKRRTNVRAALERIIEKAGDVEVTASAVVAAIQAYSKINSVGQWIDPSEQVGMRDLFERMRTQTRACNDAIGYAQKLSHPFSEALALVFASSVDPVLRDRRNDHEGMLGIATNVSAAKATGSNQFPIPPAWPLGRGAPHAWSKRGGTSK